MALTAPDSELRVVALDEVDLDEAWGSKTDEIRSRSRYVSHWMTGTRSSACVYFEVDPGKAFGRHYHTAEETIVVLAGTAEVVVGDKTSRLQGPALTVAPALARHDIRCVGTETLRCLGVWASSSVVSVWDEPLQPLGKRRMGTPIPTV